MRQWIRPALARVESTAIIGAAVIAVFFTLGTKGLWIQNFPNILVLASEVGIVAIGQALLIITGEFDMSVGSVFAFAGTTFVSLMYLNFGVPLSFVLTLVLCCGVGLVNSLATLRFKVHSLIATLGALYVYRGLAYILTNGVELRIPSSLRGNPLLKLLGGAPLGFDTVILVMCLATVLFSIILSMTKFGNHALAVGADPKSAQSCGVSPSKTKAIAFVICSALAGLSGILVTCRESVIYYSSGMNTELETIVAAVIGGCVLSGGVGSIWGTAIGAIIISSLRGGILMMHAPSYWYITFVGFTLILFMILSTLTRGLNGILGQTGKR